MKDSSLHFQKFSLANGTAFSAILGKREPCKLYSNFLACTCFSLRSRCKLGKSGDGNRILKNSLPGVSVPFYFSLGFSVQNFWSFCLNGSYSQKFNDFWIWRLSKEI